MPKSRKKPRRSRAETVLRLVPSNQDVTHTVLPRPEFRDQYAPARARACTSAPTPINPKSHDVLRTAPGESEQATVALTLLKPTVRAAVTIKAFDQDRADIDVTALALQLRDQADLVQGGDLAGAERMLVAQSQTLDELFHRLTRRSIANMGVHMEAADTYLRLALRAQSQARAALETLAVIKNPPSVAFVRQANIANGHQQINNHSRRARVREKKSRQNKLLEENNGKRLDHGAQSASVGIDPEMAAMGKVDGTEDDTRKVSGGG